MTSATAADLAGSTLLASLSPEELQAAARYFTVRAYPKGAILVTEGDRLGFFGIVLSGKVKFFFIARSPFLLLASADAAGGMDVSPKGDAPGVVRVLDDSTLAVPDRPGNRTAATFCNLLHNPRVGLFFLIPGRQETLRVKGAAMIVRDRWLRDELVASGKTPEFAIVVRIEEVFFHCPKCMIRSRLWDPAHWPETGGLASFAQAVVDAGRLAETPAEVQALLDKSVRERLY